MASKAPFFDPISLFLKHLSDRAKNPGVLWKIKKKKMKPPVSRKLALNYLHFKWCSSFSNFLGAQNLQRVG